MKEFTRKLIKEFDEDVKKIKHKKVKSYQALNDMGNYYHKKWVKLLIESETSKQKEICQNFLACLIVLRKNKFHKIEIYEKTKNDKILESEE